MNTVDIIAYILIILSVVRLARMQGRCPTAWVLLAVGAGILWHRGKFN
jgi:hypothetical protein